MKEMHFRKFNITNKTRALPGKLKWSLSIPLEVLMKNKLSAWGLEDSVNFLLFVLSSHLKLNFPHSCCCYCITDS